VNEKENRSFQLSFKGTLVSTLIFGAALLIAPLGRTRQQGQQQQQGSMAGMDMRANGDMDMSGMAQAWRPWPATCI
jgi:hypothetical protein